MGTQIPDGIARSAQRLYDSVYGFDLAIGSSSPVHYMRNTVMTVLNVSQ